jgi:hypothetical protein
MTGADRCFNELLNILHEKTDIIWVAYQGGPIAGGAMNYNFAAIAAPLLISEPLELRL